MGKTKTNRFSFVIALLGIAIAWFSTAYQDEEITQEEVKELIRQILGLLNMSLDDIV